MKTNLRGGAVRKEILGAIHSTKISGNFVPKLNGSVRSNRKSFEKTGPPFEVDHFSRSDRSEFWRNGWRLLSRQFWPLVFQTAESLEVLAPSVTEKARHTSFSP